MDLLTLDTNILHDLWRPDPTWRADAEQIVGLARAGEVHITVSRHIDLDLMGGEVARRVDELVDEGVITRLMGLFILDESAWDGGDVLGDQDVVDLEIKLRQSASLGNGPEPPGSADWLLMHAHKVYGRELFITRDGPILRIADELAGIGIVVMTPTDYLASRAS